MQPLHILIHNMLVSSLMFLKFTLHLLFKHFGKKVFKY